MRTLTEVLESVKNYEAKKFNITMIVVDDHCFGMRDWNNGKAKDYFDGSEKVYNYEVFKGTTSLNDILVVTTMNKMR